MGTTMKKAGSRAAFKKVDYEYPLKVAGMARQNGAEKFAEISREKNNFLNFFLKNLLEHSNFETY